MAINKNFVIKNGAEINTKLLVVDADTQRVGVGTTVASYTLHVFGTNEQPGGIGASVVNVTGVTTTVLLNVGAAATFSNGPVFIGVGQSTGTPLQPLQVGSATTTQGIYVSGDVGIGETFPAAKLEVVPESTRIAGLFTGTTSDDMVRITQLGSGNALTIEDSSNPDSTPFIVDASGDTGIGTDKARAKLHVLPNVNGIAGLFSGSTSNDMVRITQMGEGNALVVEDVVADGTPFIVKATGDTGIGIGSDPIGAKLHVVPSTPGIGGMFTGATAGDMVRITQTGGGNALVVEDEGNPDSSPFIIKASGDTGIGTNSPGAKLHVTPTTTAAAGIFSGTTSADMVRITQTGSGNALVVEDEANEDATSFVVSGVGSVGIGTNVPRYLLDVDGTKLASEGVAVGQTAVYIRGDVKIVGDLSCDDITFDQAVHTFLNVSGFGTITDLLVPETASINIGIITSIQGGNLSLAGITSFLKAPGISTLSYLTGESANYTGISTLARVTGEDINLTGIATIARLNAPGISTIGFLQNTTLNVSGFSTLGGVTATALNVSGITTVAGGFEANQGINAARLNVSGISTLGSVTATEAVVTGISTLGQVSATGISNTGVTTSNSYTIDGTTIVNSSRQLQNIASLDATTTATIESAIANAPNTFTDLKVTGITTLGFTTATTIQVGNEGLSVAGVSTFNGNVAIGTDSTAGRLNIVGDVSGLIARFSGNSDGVLQIRNDDSNVVEINASGSTDSLVLGAGSGTERLRIDSSGKVAIGTDSGTTRALRVKAPSNNSAHISLIDTDSTQEIWQVGNQADGDAFMQLLTDEGTVATKFDASGINFINGGNLGIGTDNPSQQKLTIDVKDSGTAQASFNGINIANTDSTTNNGAAIIFGQTIAGNSFARIGVINSDRTGSSEDQDIFFGTLGGGSYGERLRITSTGDFVVGGGATFGASVGVVTYFGDGSNLTGVIAGVNISADQGIVGAGITNIKFTGSGISTVTTDATLGIATISVSGGGGGGVTEVDTQVSTTSPTGVGSFAVASHRSAAIIAQIDQTGSGFQVGRYLMIHDGTTVTVVEESAVATGSMLGSFDGAIVGSNAEFRVTMVSSGIATVTTKIDTVTV